jgi:two-component system phosphate regulon sensor histidine kinase PhoR
MITLVLILAAALAAALFRLQRHRRALRLLEAAVRRREHIPAEGIALGLGADWDRLCAAIDRTWVELAHLHQGGPNRLAQLEVTLGSLQEAVLIVDGNNHVLFANAALQSIFPDAKNIIGRRLELVLHSRGFLAYVETVRTGRAQAQHPVEFSGAAGSVWVEVTGTLIPSPDGRKAPWILFVLHDITRQRRLEAMRKEFVANVSHELRTPLSVIMGYVETLVDGHRDIPIEDRERFLHTIQRHTARLNSLLEDLLALSRLESPHPGLAPESVPLAGLITTLHEDYLNRGAASAHQLHLSLDASLGNVFIDPLKITQAIENLIDNALKYSPAGSRIDLVAARRPGEVDIRVQDNGPGIPAADLPHIFERFYRVDKGRSREKGGTGLGLSIVKHIVQLHGGRVWVESRQGQGTAIGFTLPQRG